MTNETLIHPESLSDDQLDQLVRFLIDEFGIGLSGDELDESIGLVMENIPGFERKSEMERPAGVEPASLAWEAKVIPIYDGRLTSEYPRWGSLSLLLGNVRRHLHPSQ